MKEIPQKSFRMLLSISTALYIVLTGALICFALEISNETLAVVYATIGFLSLCYLLTLIWTLIIISRNSSEKCPNDVLFKKNNTNDSLSVPVLLLDSQNFWVRFAGILPWNKLLCIINNNKIPCTRPKLGISILMEVLHGEDIDQVLKLIQNDINVQYFVGVNLYSGMLTFNKSLYDKQKSQQIFDIVRTEVFSDNSFLTNGYSKKS